MESHNDPEEMNTSTMKNGAWTCPIPCYMEDWTQRDMYHVLVPYVCTCLPSCREGGVGTLCKISVYLAAGMAVEAVPVMALKGQHVLCGQAVGILLHPRFVA